MELPAHKTLNFPAFSQFTFPFFSSSLSELSLFLFFSFSCFLFFTFLSVTFPPGRVVSNNSPRHLLSRRRMFTKCTTTNINTPMIGAKQRSGTGSSAQKTIQRGCNIKMHGMWQRVQFYWLEPCGAYRAVVKRYGMLCTLYNSSGGRLRGGEAVIFYCSNATVSVLPSSSFEILLWCSAYKYRPSGLVGNLHTYQC